MKFTPVVLTLSAVIALAQVAALPVTPFLQESGLIPGNPSSNTEHTVYKEASDSLPVHISLVKRGIISGLGLIGGNGQNNEDSSSGSNDSLTEFVGKIWG
ncbi:MAG: hypothetical protein J3Q66DRAFT_444316 [Benniella sp.]|nr:MAG: hypothetical protein J3Q66DRAFT_444316 [Benniella sp.]